jgi:hypothetical protein
MPDPKPRDQKPRIAKPWQPRFSIGGMMLATLVCAVAMAAVSYLYRYRHAERFGTLLFLIITLAGPLVLVVAVSLARSLADILSRPRRK